MNTIKLQDIRLTIEQQKMVVDNLKLVDFVANKNKGYIGLDGLEYEDLQAIGRVGLIRAVIRFDPDQSASFSSLAVPFIKGEITHYIRDKTSAIKTQRNAKPIKVVSLDRTFTGCEKDLSMMDIIPDNKEYYQEPTIDGDLLRAIETLSREDRDILVMTQINGCDHKTTAKWLETHPQHITKRIKFAVDAVKTILANPNLKLSKPKLTRNALPFVVEGIVCHPSEKHRCVICNSIYGINNVRNKNPVAQTCSSSCATSLGVSNNSARYQSWTKQELEFCDNLIGKRNLEDIYEDLLIHNQVNNLPVRSKDSVKTKLTRSYKSIVVRAEDLSMRELARQLDIKVNRIRVWEKNGLKSVKTSSGKYKITCNDLTQFAKTDHYRFYGIDRDKLSKLITDLDVLEKCANAIPHVNRIEVVRTDTGKKYRSVRAAASATGVTKNYVLSSGWIEPAKYITSSSRSKDNPINLDSMRGETKLLSPEVKHNKRWMFISPEGKIYETNNLAMFAKVHNLNKSALWQVWQGRNQSHIGWKKYFT